MITWHLKRFEELTVDELWDIYRHRIEVFVVEQKNPYEDVDKVDKEADHLWATNEDGEMLAYIRFYREEDYVSFGRVVTTPLSRGQGMGRQLLNKVLEEIDQVYPGETIKIHAQTDKEGFYAKFGFVTKTHKDDQYYMNTNIPHILMVREPDHEK